MTIASIGQAGTASEKTSDTSLVFSPTNQLDAGNAAVLWVAIDNISTADGVTSDVSASDSKGNTWTKIREQTETEAGVALDGATGALFMCRGIATTILTSDTITISLSGNSTAKGAVVWEYSLAANMQLTLEQVVFTSGSGDVASISVTSLPSREYLLVHLIAMENITALTEDADYTEITETGPTGGAGDTNVTVSGGWRIATLTTDTIDAATTPDREHVQFLAALYETSTGLSVTVGQATETDTAFVDTPDRAPAVGLSTETDTATVSVADRMKPVGQVTETNTATVVDHSKEVTVGLATETDTATVLDRLKTQFPGLATETDTATVVIRDRTKTLQSPAQYAETNTAFVISPIKQGAGTTGFLSQAIETDTATVVAHDRARILAQAVETDTATVLSRPKTIITGTAVEVNTALQAVATKGRTLSIVTETDTANPVTPPVASISVVGTLNAAQEKISDTQLALAGVTLAVGDRVLVWAAIDNLATVDGDSTNITVTDTAGNTYTRIRERTETEAGVAGDGVTGALFLCNVTVAMAAGSIFLNSSSAVLAKAISAFKFSSGRSLQVETNVVGNSPAITPPDLTISGIPSREYLFAYLAARENNAATMTPDAAHTAITPITTTGGATLSNVAIMGSFRIASGTGETVNGVIFTNTRESVQILAALFQATDNIVSVGMAVESDTALAVSPIIKLIETAVEINTALVVTPSKAGPPIAQVVETNLASDDETDYFLPLELSVYEETIGLLVDKAVTNILATSADTAFAVIPVLGGKNVVTNLATETDVALGPITYTREGLIGLATETDTATVVARLKDKALGQASEVDTATAASPERARAVAQASELNTAMVIGRLKDATVGQAVETDTATALGGQKVVNVVLVLTTDTAHRITPDRTRTVSGALEVDEALSINVDNVPPINQVLETDTAFSITRLKMRELSLPQTLDTAQAVTPILTKNIGLATETDTAQLIAANRDKTVGLTAEIDTATGLLAVKTITVGMATETDSAFSSGGERNVLVFTAQELDTAFVISHFTAVAMGIAQDGQYAQIVTAIRTRGIVQPQETDTALPITPNKHVATVLTAVPAGRVDSPAAGEAERGQ